MVGPTSLMPYACILHVRMYGKVMSVVSQAAVLFQVSVLQMVLQINSTLAESSASNNLYMHVPIYM